MMSYIQGINDVIQGIDDVIQGIDDVIQGIDDVIQGPMMSYRDQANYSNITVTTDQS